MCIQIGWRRYQMYFWLMQEWVDFARLHVLMMVAIAFRTSCSYVYSYVHNMDHGCEFSCQSMKTNLQTKFIRAIYAWKLFKFMASYATGNGKVGCWKITLHFHCSADLSLSMPTKRKKEKDNKMFNKCVCHIRWSSILCATYSSIYT